MLTSSKQNFIPKGWGYELWITNNNLYCGKLLFFIKNKKCSWHFHKQKDEVFYIRKGKLLVYYSLEDDLSKASSIILKKGDSFHVKPGLRHQMIALKDTEMYEFSTQHFDEDSFRIEKGD